MIHGLTFVGGSLEAHVDPVITINLQEALISLYQFLFAFQKKCVLTAHNCAFDYPRLFKAIRKTYLDKYFQRLVYGFSDTLPLIRSISEVKTAGYNKLENIAQRLKIQGFQAHNAIDDVAVLNKIIVALKMWNNQIEKQIIESSLIWYAAEEKILLSDKCNSSMKLYDELKSCTSVQMRKRMIACDITI